MTWACGAPPDSVRAPESRRRKETFLPHVQILAKMGNTIYATTGTAAAIQERFPDLKAPGAARHLRLFQCFSSGRGL